MNMRKNLVIFVLISTAFYTHGQHDRGSICIIEHTKSSGICKHLEECPSVIQDIRHNESYTRCSFAEKMEIVCCPEVIILNCLQENSSLRISERKCDEYKSAAFKEVQSSLQGEEPKKLFVDACPVKPRILIPILVPSEFSHMALIGFDSFSENVTWLCSGTLISDEYVLTTAHCTKTLRYGYPKLVRLGEHNFNNEDDTHPEDYNISAIITHPEYNNMFNYNDIALLKLDRKVKLSPDKRPACLPTTFESNEKNAISTGWCRNLRSTRSSLLNLAKVDLVQFPLTECNETYASSIGRRMVHGIISTQLCAGLRDNTNNFCPDDSGGPLQIHHPNHYCMYTVIGVRSFKIDSDAGLRIPEIYTRIFSYLDWIEGIVWKNSC